MDSDSTYLLEIKLVANIKKVRKDVRCWCFDKTVDSDTINLKDLVDEITDQYPPGYLEVAHVQYYDADLKTFPVVNTDQELMSCFRNIVTTKVVHMFIAYSDLFYTFVYSHLNTFTSNYLSFFPSQPKCRTYN